MEKAGDAPEDAKRFDRARRKGAAQIERFPTELIEDARHDLLGGGVVAADEHGGAPGRVGRIYHARVADRAERLHEPHIGMRFLKALHQRFVDGREVLEHAVDRRRWGDRVGRVHHDLAGDAGACESQDVERGRALDREHQRLAERRRLGK